MGLVTREMRVSRGDRKAIKSDAICRRVLSALERTDRDLFLKRAIKLAEENDLRLWQSKTNTLEESARDSLRILLGEKHIPSTHGVYTGVNEYWVLEIWERACDHFDAGALHLVREGESEEKFTRSTCSLPLVGQRIASIKERLLEAYLQRNDDEILKIADEIG